MFYILNRQCFSAIPELSENGRTLLNSYQNVYRSALFQYCSTAYQRNGPSRFNDLLFLLHVVTKTHDDIKKYFTLFQFFQPTEQPSQVHQDVIEFINWFLSICSFFCNLLMSHFSIQYLFSLIIFWKETKNEQCVDRLQFGERHLKS